MEKLKKAVDNKKKRITAFYENQDTIDRKIFWGIVPLTCLVGIASVIGTTVEKLGTLAIVSGILCTVIPLLLAVGCYLQNDCRRYYKYFCLCLNCILMPMTFLSNGGLHSGMPMYCLGVFLFCSFCVTKRDRITTSLISLAVYLVLFLITTKYPGIVMPIRSSFIETDIILSFAVGGLSMMIIISRAMTEYNTQRYKEVNNGLIDSLGAIIEFRSLETGNHVRNIKRFTSVLLECANEFIPGAAFTREEINMISSAAVLHDIGKIAVPDQILQKPGKLTAEEYEVIKLHPVDGCTMIETMKEYQNRQYYEYCYEICRHHHERYDGTGYPDRLKGEEIPLISQIVAIADVYEALTSKRVYKEAFGLEEATDIILNRSTGMFSERILECFKMAKPKLDEMILEGKGGGFSMQKNEVFAGCKSLHHFKVVDIDFNAFVLWLSMLSEASAIKRQR